ncbi:MAG: hypothetical protein Fur0024_2130 [Patescibacteria group bacterium]
MYQVLIEKRKEVDENVKSLICIFQVGKMESMDFRNETLQEVKEETGLDGNFKEIVFDWFHIDVLERICSNCCILFLY